MYSDNASSMLTPPAYPASAGQGMPDLNLAGVSTPQTSLAGGNFTDSTPPQNIAVPPLSSTDPYGDMQLLGIDPAINYFELNLAGNALPIADPAKLTMPTPLPPAQGNAPTFSKPFASVPPLRPFDLTSPGIDAFAPFDADPATGDLLQFDRPRGLFILAASDVPMMSDPLMPDLDLYDRPAGLDMPGPALVDPALPDLQHPMLDQQVEMPDRPADLAPTALAMIHGLPAYEQLPTANSKALWMAQQGNNSARERHLGTLMLGLDREEGQA
ncbi:MAG: hypothetical protein ACRDIV_07180 [Ktedonobacteraceae bacterium]